MTEPRTKMQDEENAESQMPGSDSLAGGDAAASSGGQVAELKDQLLRALAETENTRRRAQKEREDTQKYAVANFAKEMLNVADNFRRALEAVPKSSDDAGMKNLVTGVEAIERQLQQAFDRFGIKELDPLGKPFDPHFHRVMMEIDDPDQAPGTVVQVLQAGYVIHDRLLREALVAVAKGASATAAKVDTSA
ncbi:MAG: nucleotide exchange factor GrpE [Pseudomonadota bacterium]|nr:nucleotide exchange factor GrpE [Pseudomonadota bacterium]